jgi:hypothetical protein
VVAAPPRPAFGVAAVPTPGARARPSPPSSVRPAYRGRRGLGEPVDLGSPRVHRSGCSVEPGHLGSPGVHRSERSGEPGDLGSRGVQRCLGSGEPHHLGSSRPFRGAARRLGRSRTHSPADPSVGVLRAGSGSRRGRKGHAKAAVRPSAYPIAGVPTGRLLPRAGDLRPSLVARAVASAMSRTTRWRAARRRRLERLIESPQHRGARGERWFRPTPPSAGGAPTRLTTETRGPRRSACSEPRSAVHPSGPCLRSRDDRPWLGRRDLGSRWCGSSVFSVAPL